MAFTHGFGPEHREGHLVHFRHLGEKEEGKELYKNVLGQMSQSMELILTPSLKHDQDCEESIMTHNDAKINHIHRNIEVRPRKMNNEILESTSSFKEFKKGDGIKKMYASVKGRSSRSPQEVSYQALGINPSKKR